MSWKKVSTILQKSSVTLFRDALLLTKMSCMAAQES